MLRLKNIVKDYTVAGNKVRVLKGLNLSFRKNEFVSILGPSGCGKTTTLNIIGGLDKYTDGDLFIAGISTKKFKDRDWDIYRNQRIGFIFQSYNLIPHQTVLGNVELALTISGISKEERIKRAKKALDKVGLSGEYNKKPNQLSGGQCQRVAIARALVNEPEILLADEPTGALDTKTSIQIMELIKEIAQDRLVIMVTHNPELAEKYSNRIIRLVDGEVIEDSNPFSEEDEINENKLMTPEEINKKSKAKMSWWTAFKLSLKNLLSKKGRTIMTCIACSIGITGVSSVLAVSSGVKNYIASMQDDMLSGNPIKVSETAIDFSSLMESMSNREKQEFIKEKGYINIDSLVAYLAKTYSNMDAATIKNNITQEYIDYVLGLSSEYVAAINLDYGLDVTNNIYTDFTVNNDTESMSLSAIKNIYTSVLKKTTFADYASLITSMTDILSQAPTNQDYILSQYNLLDGKLAQNQNEIMVVVDKSSALTDVVLAQLGYYTQEEFINIAYKVSEDESYNPSLDVDHFSYSEIENRKFYYYPNNQVYNSQTLNPVSPFTYNPSSSTLDDGIELKVVGILEPKSNISYGCLRSGFYYTKALTDYIIQNNFDSEINSYLRNNNKESFTSTEYAGTPVGITYEYNYQFEGTTYTETGYVGTTNQMTSIMSSIGMGGGSSSTNDIYILSMRNLGGCKVANEISIYPVNFDTKDKVREYLDAWNKDGDIVVNGVTYTKDQRSEIKYTDTLSIIINMINSMINIITIALVVFTGLSLVVSCVMIAIITYVSVVERIKEIGVIRSLGGRKRDVSNLFNAETIMIGTASGLFGIAVTYLLSLIANLIVNGLTGISTIAALPALTAIIMILLSIGLTVLAGLIPASKAAHQDPVNALRTE